MFANLLYLEEKHGNRSITGAFTDYHQHHHPPLAVEQAITSFLQAHQSLARVAISCTVISFSSYPSKHPENCIKFVKNGSSNVYI